MDDGALIRSLQDQVRQLEAAIGAQQYRIEELAALAREYTPRVEQSEALIEYIQTRQHRNLQGMHRLAERLETIDHAAAIMAAAQLPGTGSGDEQSRPVRHLHARRASRERPPWLRVVKVFPIIAGTSGAVAAAAWRHRANPVSIPPTAALFTGGIAGTATAISYRDVPAEVHAVPAARAQSPSALVTVTPSSTHRDRRDRRREHPRTSPVPAASPSLSPLATPSVMPSPMGTVPPVPSPPVPPADSSPPAAQPAQSPSPVASPAAMPILPGVTCDGLLQILAVPCSRLRPGEEGRWVTLRIAGGGPSATGRAMLLAVSAPPGTGRASGGGRATWILAGASGRGRSIRGSWLSGS